MNPPLTLRKRPFCRSACVQADRNGLWLLRDVPARVDRDHDRHARAQNVLAGRFRRQDDADRHALDDLGEVAGGVVGRQQGEDRAGAAGNAADRAVESLAGQGVDGDLRLVADLQRAYLRLLEVGVDIDLVERDDRHQALAGADEVAELHVGVGDEAVDRRRDRHEGEVARRLVLGDLELVDLAGGLDALRLQHLNIGLRLHDAGLGAGERGDGLVACGGGGVERRLRAIGLGGEVVGAVEIGGGAGDGGLGRNLLRLGLLQAGAGSLDLRVDARERGLGGGALGLGALQRDALVAIVELDQRLAGLDLLVLRHRDRGDVGGQLGRDRRHFGADIGVVGRDDEAAIAPPVDAIPEAGGKRRAGDEDQRDALGAAALARRFLGGLGRGGHVVARLAAFDGRGSLFQRRVDQLQTVAAWLKALFKGGFGSHGDNALTIWFRTARFDCA
ncbi:hypothetical protein BOSE21B_10914 [Bosea sp. 21B]|nr:hypothetical protein BOSE21B_10914 [Bosea sp. 21B]